jgi:hypothetical protein
VVRRGHDGLKLSAATARGERADTVTHGHPDQEILVTATRSGESLVLVVEDNGKGLDGLITTSGRFLAAQPSVDSLGIGLTNTRQRLAMMYGDRYAFLMANHASGGCRVEIRLPMDWWVGRGPAWLISTSMAGSIGTPPRHRRCGPDVAEDLAVCPSDRLPLGNVRHEHAGAHHVLQSRPGPLERAANVRENLHGLRVRIVATDKPSIGPGSRRSCDKYLGAHPDGARVSDNGFPLGAGGKNLSFHRSRFPCSVYFRA